MVNIAVGTPEKDSNGVTQLQPQGSFNNRNPVASVPTAQGSSPSNPSPSGPVTTITTPDGRSTTTTGAVDPSDVYGQRKGAMQAPGSSTTPAPLPGKTSGDAAFAQGLANTAPGANPSEDDFFSQVHQQIAPLLDSITKTESAAEDAAYAAGSKEMTDMNAALGNRGLGGSSEAARLGASVNLDTAGAIAAAKKAQTDALTNVYSFLTSDAYNEFKDAQTRNDKLSSDYVANMQKTALTTVQGLAESGITSGSDLQSKNPQAYLSLLQYYNNDPTALDAALTLNQPASAIAQSWIQGSTYNQIVTDPITKKPKVQSIDLGITPPTGWVTQKIGSTSVVLQDPNDPANTIIYSTNPFTGAVTVSGTGTGLTQLKAQGVNAGSQTGDTSSVPAGGNGSASTTVSTALGVDPATPLSDVIANQGLGALVAAMVKNEGGSPAGVQNNPGNIKFTGLTGQTDSGVKATDGGTFASYATPEDGQKAIGDIVTSAATGASSAYGANPTLDSFVGTYTNTGSALGKGTNGLPTGEYGLLANVPGFNPSVPGVDQAASNYLNEYLTQGKVPTAASVGISTRSGSGAAFNQVAQRAADVYFKATGQHLPTTATLTSNKKLISGNNSILNNLSLQEGTISANADLLTSKLDAASLNQNEPLINGIINSVQNSLGDVDTASLIAQSSTLQNELGSLLALKNATGTTVHDKLESAGLISADYTPDQIAGVVKTLMQEAQNGRAALAAANAKLYMQTDPLQQDPNNPLTNPQSFASSIGLNLNAIKQDYPNLTDSEILQQYLNSQ